MSTDTEQVKSLTPEERAGSCLVTFFDNTNGAVVLRDTALCAWIAKYIADAETAMRDRCAHHAWDTLQHAFVDEATMKEVDAAIREVPE